MGQVTKRKKDKERTGEVSDDSINAITDYGSGRPTGQDHSLENYEETEPDSGVGAIQDHSDTSSDIARIRD